MKTSQTQKNRAERTAYRGIDAVQSLADMNIGVSNYAAEKAFAAFHEIINYIETLEVIDGRKSK